MLQSYCPVPNCEDKAWLYTLEFGITYDHRARKNVVNFTSRLNNHVVVSPRLYVQLKDIEHGKVTCSYPVSLAFLH